MKNFILFIFDFFFLYQITFSQIGIGTSVLIIVTNDTISIGADSRRIYTHKDGSKEFVTEKKIWNIAETFFFMGGKTIIINEDNLNDTVFHAYKIMQYFTTKEKDIEKCFKYFNDSVIKKVKWVIDKSNNKNAFKDNYRYFIEAGIAKMDDGKPKIIIFRYKIDTTSYILRPIRDPDLPSVINIPLFNGLAHYLEASKYWLNDTSNYRNCRDKLITMIKIEIKNDSIAVGEPVNTVSIYHGGHKWYPPYYSSVHNEAIRQHSSKKN